MTPEEALLGVTLNAAKALGMDKTHGSLSVGKHADFAIWNISHPNELAYYLGGNPLSHLIKDGKCISM
jgi:imidazolonepropionase